MRKSQKELAAIQKAMHKEAADILSVYDVLLQYPSLNYVAPGLAAAFWGVITALCLSTPAATWTVFLLAYFCSRLSITLTKIRAAQILDDH